MALLAGVARANITPSVGFDNIGDYLRLKPAVGVGNELYAKALVLDDGHRRLALVALDVIGLQAETVADIRSRVETLTGIPGQNVVLSPSHTHSSPATLPHDNPAREYLTELAKKVAGAVCMAEQNKRPVVVGYGAGEAAVAINRWQRTDSGVRWGPNPDAPVDYEVQVIRFDADDRRPLAILVNYACHPSIMGGDNLLYSGDYTSYVQSFIEKVYDGRVTALFTPGAGGDVKIAVLSGDGSAFAYTDLEDCRKYGTIIGAEAVKVAEGIEPAAVEGIAIESRTVDLPLCSPPPLEEVEREAERLGARGDSLDERDAPLLRWAEQTAEQIRTGRVPRAVTVEVQLVRIGQQISIFVVPGELFVEVGMRLKREMGVPGAMVIAFANAYSGYMPSKRAEQWGWCEHDTSYRRLGRPANISGAAEDVLSQALAEMMAATTEDCSEP